MKITQAGAGMPARRSGKAERTRAGDAFRQHVDDAAPSKSAGAAATTPLAALSSLLAVQEVPDPMQGRKQAILHGHALLDELKELQIGLAQGWIPEDKLRQISEMLDRPRPALEDPSLDRILDEIELRAAVELAKLDRRKA